MPHPLFLFSRDFCGILELWSIVHRKPGFNTRFFNKMILINIQNTLEFS